MKYSHHKLYFWIFPLNTKFKTISSLELRQASKLTPKKAIQYRLSRGNIRYALSKLFAIKPLEVPLYSLPGKAPTLSKNFGYVSMSHCSDALFVGWSKDRIGVDIERVDRKANLQNIITLAISLIIITSISRRLFFDGFGSGFIKKYC